MTKVKTVQRTVYQPARSGSSHAGHSNAAFIPEHIPFPTLPSIPDEQNVDRKPEFITSNQFGSTQINVSSIGSPTQELEMETSQVVVDSSIKTEWKKPEGAIELVPTIEDNSIPSTSNIGSSQVVVASKIEGTSKEFENFDKTITDKDSNNPMSVNTFGEQSKHEIVAMPIRPIIEDQKIDAKPLGDGQIGSSQMVVESSPKTEVVVIQPIQSTTIESERNGIVSTQTITSGSVAAQQITSSTSTTTIYQSNSTMDSQIDQIVSSIIANESVFGKKIVEPTTSISTVQVTHEVPPSETILVTESVTSTADDEISEAFKDFVGGLMSTTPDIHKIEPIFSSSANEGDAMHVTVVSTDAPASLPIDVSTTIEAAKDIMFNEMATVPSDRHSVEVIESIPSVVEVVTTQPTPTGYEETKVIATKFTSDGPTFLEVSKTGFQTDVTSSTELHSTQMILKSTFSYEDDQLISASKVCSDSIAMQNETSVTQTSSNVETFTSFTQTASSQVVSSPEAKITPSEDDGPTIVEISSTAAAPDSPQITSYVVSEPSYERESSTDYANDYAECSYSCDDTSYSYDDHNDDD